jgi:hypothetical protein
MKKALSSVAVTLLLALQMGATAYAEIHKSTGKVVKINPAQGTLELVDKGRHLKLVMGKGATLFDEEGQPLKGLKGIQVGDVVSEECKIQTDGPSIATKIKVIQRGWQTEGTPEK